ncbi:MAG: LysM peptidoglycan-binding domain-containing protein, partial [Advenella sp.]
SVRYIAQATPGGSQGAVRPATATVRAPVLAQQAAPAVRAAAYRPRAATTVRAAPEHFVTQGETLYSLAKRYGTTVDDLKALNNIGTEGLKAGLRLRLPGTAIRG